MDIILYFNVISDSTEDFTILVNGKAISKNNHVEYNGINQIFTQLGTYKKNSIEISIKSGANITVNISIQAFQDGNQVLFRDEFTRAGNTINFKIPLPQQTSVHVPEFIKRLKKLSRNRPDHPFKLDLLDEVANKDYNGIVANHAKRPEDDKEEEYNIEPMQNFSVVESEDNDYEILEDDYQHYLQIPTINNVEAEKSRKNKLIEVFYATERNKYVKRKNGLLAYGNNRGNISFGTCLVNLPKEKIKGEIPRPVWWKLEFSNSEDKHMFIKQIDELQPEGFFNKLQQVVEPSKEAFIFVHGYNVSFEESILRAAQIAKDIDFKGVPMVYSWPSKRSVLGYVADGDNTKFSTPNLANFIKDVIKKTGAAKLHLIAHSMGNRALTDALVLIHQQNPDKKILFNQIILAAPDIDAEIFVRDIAPKISTFSQRVTLYASSKDKALFSSKKLHGNINRTGYVGDEITIAEGIDTVDASKIDTDLIGHGYFASTAALIQDIFHLTRHNHPPEERNLRKIELNGPLYWEFEE
ncbi:MAG: alpha/beta hydrolase [Bacteroidota bacterium]